MTTKATRRTKKAIPTVADDARFVVDGLGHNAVVAWEFSKHLHSTLDIGEMLIALEASCEVVSSGELRPSETLLASQAVALNAIFTRFSMLSHMNLTKESGPNLEAAERLLRLALRAQGQCRATLETLAMIKNPPVFARQANIANGPQQVNNSMLAAGPALADGCGGHVRARAEIEQPVQNELLETYGERLDVGAAQPTGASDTALASVGAVHGAAHSRG